MSPLVVKERKAVWGGGGKERVLKEKYRSS